MEDRCPHIRTLRGGDETRDFCRETEKPSGRIHPCLLVGGGECETWNEIKQENMDYEWSMHRDKY